MSVRGVIIFVIDEASEASKALRHCSQDYLTAVVGFFGVWGRVGSRQGTGAVFYLHSVLCSARAFWEPLPAGYLSSTRNLTSPDASQMLGINTQLSLSSLLRFMSEVGKPLLLGA